MLNVPTGTFHFAENFRCKSLIPRRAFWAEQWIQGVRLWKECPLSRGFSAYLSRLDRRGVYFIRYAGTGRSKVCWPRESAMDCLPVFRKEQGSRYRATDLESMACVLKMAVAKLASQCYKRMNGQGYQHILEPRGHEDRRISRLAGTARS